MTIEELLLKHYPDYQIKEWSYFCTTRDRYCCFQKGNSRSVLISVNELVDKDKIDWDNIHKRNKQMNKLWKGLELVSSHYKMMQCPNITFQEAIPITDAENYFDEC